MSNTAGVHSDQANLLLPLATTDASVVAVVEAQIATVDYKLN
jgi:hypothetical protein